MALTERAQRFNLPVRILWRRTGDTDWTPAIGLNVSRTGLLFQTAHTTEIGVEIELILEFAPETAPWVDVANLICFGRVVRQKSEGEGATLATTIEHYSFLREG